MDGLTEFVTGLLEADGTLSGTVSQERRATLQRVIDGTSAWSPYSFGRLDRSAYDRRLGIRIAPWQTPTGSPARNADVEWFNRRLSGANTHSIRVALSSASDWRRVKKLTIEVARQSYSHVLSAGGYVRTVASGEWVWQWPLRVGVVAGPNSSNWVKAVAQRARFADLYQVFETDGDEECEFLIVSPSTSAGVTRRAAIVVAVGYPPEFADRDGPPQFDGGAAGTILSRRASPGWFEHLVVELSHDLPVDLALRAAEPNALLVADPDFVERTTIRQWGHEIVERLDGVGNSVAARILEHVLLGEFNSERTEAATTTAAASAAANTGVDIATRGGPPHAAAVGNGDEAPGKRADLRRLQAVVRRRLEDSRKTVVTDRFVAGAEHDVRVCIAADQREGAVVADSPFEHPAPGTKVTLDVSIIVAGHRTKRRLQLPPTNDTKWTVAVPFQVPRRAKGFEVQVEVAYQRRVIQSATLSGTPLVLSVDQSAPLSELADRETAHGAITLVDGPRGNPAVIDLDQDAGDVDPQQVKSATKSLRKELFAAFTSPPTDLAGAAGALTKLAVRGSTLYQRLAGGSKRYHTADTWIHVNAFTTRDVPIELAYDHPMPDDDSLVPICNEALAGATNCSASCPSRDRHDVVCPFGFWATSKIIERRNHVSGRNSATPATQRQLNPVASSVLGVSVKANEVDATASGRIAKALAGVVPMHVVATSWADLEHVVKRHPTLVVLVTHTVESESGDDLDTALELNGDVKPIHRIGATSVNPEGHEPGPVVLALGCDTNVLTAGFTDLVVNLHAARAEIVVSALSPIPGKGVADFLERFMPVLDGHLKGSGRHRFGAAMLATRRATIAAGDLMALALTASGDADVELIS